MVTYLIQQLPPQATKIRFEEPYVSDGLNLKSSGIIPPGIYQGFNPIVNGSILEIRTDPERNDSVAVVETPQLHNLTVRVTQKYNLDLSGLLPGDYPVDVVIRAVYGITPSPLVGLTDAKILVVSPVDVQPSDIRICKVVAGGPPLVINTIIPVNRNDLGGHLVTPSDLITGTVLKVSRFEWTIPAPPPWTGSFGTGPLAYVPKLVLVTSIARESACFSYLLSSTDWYSINDTHTVNTDYSSWLDRYSGSGPPYYPNHPISVYREGHIAAFADIGAFGQSGITFNYVIAVWGGGAYWRIQAIVVG